MNLALASNPLPAVLRTRSEAAASAPNLHAVLAIVARRARELTDAAGAVVELDLDGRGTAASGAARARIREADATAGTTLAWLCRASGTVLCCADATYDPRLDGAACRTVGAVSLLCVPVRHGGRVIGVLEVSDPRPRAFADRDTEPLRLLCEVVAEHVGGRESAGGPARARPPAAA